MNHQYFTDTSLLVSRIQELETQLSDLQRVSAELEKRLEIQGRERLDFDKEYGENKINWEMKMEMKDMEIDDWKKKYEREVDHKKKIYDQFQRVKAELHLILQRKYDIGRKARLEAEKDFRDQHVIARDLQIQSEFYNGQTNSRINQSPKFTTNPQGAGPGSVRERRFLKCLSDFYGY